VLAIHYGSVSVKQALSKFDIMLYSKQSVNTEQTVVTKELRMLLSCKVTPHLLGEKDVKEMALNYQEF